MSELKWYDWSLGERVGRSEPMLRKVRKTRVFLADDDEDLRLLIGRSLRSDGYEVIEASNGLELLDRLQDALSEIPLSMPEVIITDVLMPQYTGLGVLKALRRANWFTPVIVVSAHDEPHATQAKELGAVAFLKKPFDLDDLRTAVVNASLASLRARINMEAE